MSIFKGPASAIEDNRNKISDLANFTEDNDDKYPSAKAVKSYVDSKNAETYERPIGSFAIGADDMEYDVNYIMNTRNSVPAKVNAEGATNLLLTEVNEGTIIRKWQKQSESDITIYSFRGRFKVGMISTVYNESVDIEYNTKTYLYTVKVLDVSDEYNPKSPNAQSGFAVAKAVAPKADISYVDNTFSNALKGSASGEKAVAVKDISPIEHNLSVKLSRTNTVTTTLATTPSQAFEQYTQIYFNPTFEVEAYDVLTVSCYIETDDTSISSVRLTFVNVNNQSIGFVDIPANTGAIESVTFTALDSSTDQNYEVQFIFFGDAVSGAISTLDVTKTVTEEVSPEGVTISQYEKNLFDPSVLLNGTGWTENDGVYSGYANQMKEVYHSTTGNSLYNHFAPNMQYTFSFDAYNSPHPSYPSTTGTSGFYFTYSDGTKATASKGDIKYITSTTSNRYSIKSQAGKMVSGLHASLDNGVIKVNILNAQLEAGAAATEYAPYIEPQTATADAEGDVEGLVSLSPDITLVSDTENIAMELEYNADTKLYIDSKLG